MKDRQWSRREPGDIDGRAERPSERERASQSLGDVPIAEFRRQLHQLADWIADYRGRIETLRVAPDAKPGAILAALPAEPPETGESFEKIFADIEQIIVPGLVHWGHPMFLGYFGWTATAPGILGEIITAPLNVNAMTWRTSRSNACAASSSCADSNRHVVVRKA